MKKYIIVLILTALAGKTLAQNNFPTEEKYRLKNKMQVVFLEYGDLPVTRMVFYINTGQKNETPGMQAISSLTTQAMLLGNAKYNRIQQDSVSSSLGAELFSNANENYSTVGTQFLSADAAKGVDMLASVMLQPSFPGDEVAEMIRQKEAYETPSRMDASQLAGMFSRLYTYGAGNPLGRHSYKAQLDKINSEQIREFYKFNYTPKNCTLVICGKPDKEAMKQLIEKYFGGWEAPYGEVNGVSLPEPDISGKEYAFVNREKTTQAVLVWTKKAPDAGSKDLMAFEMANEALSIMLMRQIREKEGKTYGIGSTYTVDNNDGTYYVATRVRNEVMGATMESFDKVLADFYEHGAPKDIFETVKAQFQSEPAALETPQQIMALFNPLLYPDFEKRKKYLSEMGQIDQEKLNKVIKKYFKPDSYKLVIAGTENELAPQLGKIKGLVKFPLNAIEVDDVKQ